MDSSHCWPRLLQASLLTCNSRNALPSWLTPLSVRESPRRPERRLFRPARRARTSSAASHRVGLTCFTCILLPAAPMRAAWSKLRLLPSEGRLRMNHSFLWTPKHTAYSICNFLLIVKTANTHQPLHVLDGTVLRLFMDCLFFSTQHSSEATILKSFYPVSPYSFQMRQLKLREVRQLPGEQQN